MNQHVTTKTWFVIQTRPAAEYVAETEMRRVGLQPYLPQYRREYRHHRSKAWIARSFPLFEGYIFVPVIGKFGWSALKTCKGVEVEPVLKDVNGNPIPLPDDIIARIREQEECGAFDQIRTSDSRLKAGDIVTLADGSFSGMEGPLSKVRGSKNVRMLVSIFNREVCVTVPVAKIAKKL